MLLMIKVYNEFIVLYVKQTFFFFLACNILQSTGTASESMCWAVARSKYLQVDAISGTALSSTHFPVLQDRPTVCGLTGI